MPIVCVGVQQASSRVGSLIELFSRGKYSHARCMLSDLRTVVEANQEGVIQSSRTLNTLWFNLTLSPEEADLWDEFLLAQVGKGYDFPMVARFTTVFRAISKVNPEEEQEYRKSKELWFCSELAGAACIKVGRPLFRDTQPWEIPPHWIPRSLRWDFPNA